MLPLWSKQTALNAAVETSTPTSFSVFRLLWLIALKFLSLIV
jgi:hypothetical protein